MMKLMSLKPLLKNLKMKNPSLNFWLTLAVLVNSVNFTLQAPNKTPIWLTLT